MRSKKIFEKPFVLPGSHLCLLLNRGVPNASLALLCCFALKCLEPLLRCFHQWEVGCGGVRQRALATSLEAAFGAVARGLSAADGLVRRSVWAAHSAAFATELHYVVAASGVCRTAGDLGRTASKYSFQYLCCHRGFA
jgi:hypothetical protein